MIPPEQVQALVAALTRIADRPYTVTGAADWPILLVLCGLIFALVGMMWRDLKLTIRDDRSEWRRELKDHRESNEKDLKDHREANEKDVDLLWSALRECQGDCCPRKKE